MITVHGFAGSRSLRVLWALEEAGAEYRYIPVDLPSGAGRKPPFVELNPAGKVPLLTDGTLRLTESAAICSYVADRFPDSGLAPEPRTAARAQYDRWCLFVATELEQPLWTLAKHSFVLPPKHRVPAVMDTARWEFSVAARMLAAGLGEQEHLLGEDFTAADILAGHTLAWARSQELPLEAPGLDAYADRVLARPALARARAREQAAAP